MEISGVGGSVSGPRYRVVDLASLEAVSCPCGTARRALHDEPSSPGTIHLTEIDREAQRHYHCTLTETYFVIECAPGAYLELDDHQVQLRPEMLVVIPPGVRHRLVGRARILNIVVPNFDPADEILDEC